MTKATVSKWETGRSEPNLQQLDVLAEALGRSTDYFVRRGKAVAEGRAAYDARRASNAQEEALLVRFRALPTGKRQGLLALIAADA